MNPLLTSYWHAAKGLSGARRELAASRARGSALIHGQSRNKMDRLSETPLATARSCLPSPLKSPTATD
jgi:hypothetical protein